MKINFTYKLANLMKWNMYAIALIMAIVFLIPGHTNGQGFMGKNKIFLIGQVVNELNGAPLKGHKLFIESDTTYEPNLSYNKVVYTDEEGYYYDTIQTYNLKGALLISTFDYKNAKYDTTVFYRFNWSEDNILFANFALPTEPLPVNYQANFYYIRNPNGSNGQEYKFIDITNSQDIISWEWDFGDGTISHIQNPTHVFAPGLQKVSLKVEIQSSPTSKPYITSLVKVFNVTSTNYFHMGGHVFAGYFPIDQGSAYLYKIENNNLILIDTAMFSDSLGYYLFYQLIEGEYIVKAELDTASVLFEHFMGTYYGDKLHWEQADTIFHESTVFEYDIHLMPNEKSMAGPGKLAGEINYVSGGDEIIAPACNISIILYNEYGNPVDICHSDDQGQFELIDLDMNNYYLHAEVTGKYTDPLFVELDNNNLEITKIEFSIDENTVYGIINYAGIDENMLNNNISDAYPNPAIDRVHFDIGLLPTSSITLRIMDASGSRIMEKVIQTSGLQTSVSVPVSSLPSGIYFVQILTDSQQAVTRKLIK